MTGEARKEEDEGNAIIPKYLSYKCVATGTSLTVLCASQYLQFHWFVHDMKQYLLNSGEQNTVLVDESIGEQSC